MLKVSSGLLRGLPLRSPTGTQTRPSSERLRQGIFNVLRHYRWNDSVILDGARIIDLFAGTGALGIEAVSNGAAEACFIEPHAAAVKALEANLAAVRRSFEAQGLAPPTLELVSRELGTLGRAALPKARIIFCDPPYEKGWFEKTLSFAAQPERLEEGGLLVYEARGKEQLPAETPGLRLFDSKSYGSSVVHYYVRDERR